MTTKALALIFGLVWTLALTGPDLCQAAAPTSEAHLSLAGSYVGYLLPNKQKIMVPATLFVFPVQREDFLPDLAAILKLRLGGESSREYISFSYGSVAYDNSEHSFSLDEDAQDLSIYGARLIDGRLTASYRSSNSQSEGKLLFIASAAISDSAAFRQLPASILNDPLLEQRTLLHSLAGTYQSTCFKKNSELKLETSKWHHSTNLINNSMPGYRITGRLSTQDGSCQLNQLCVKKNFLQGNYNFYHGYLRLTGFPSNLKCQIMANKLTCDNGCTYTKTLPLFPDRPQDHSAPEEIQSYFGITDKIIEAIDLPVNRNSLKIFEGNYEGSLYHLASSKIQPLKVSVQFYPTFRHHDGSQGFDISMSSALFFGAGFARDHDFISVDFKIRLFPTSYQILTFDSGNDVIMNVSSWNQNSISGQWISKSFGLVGPFVIERQRNLEMEQGNKFINPIPGNYRGKIWQFQLTTLGDHEIAPTESLIFPLPIHGNAHIPGITAMLPIVRGSYDFYGNSIALELVDGRVVIGATGSRGLHLFWPPKPIWGVVDKPQTLAPHKRLP